MLGTDTTIAGDDVCHQGRNIVGVGTRVAQRIFALMAAIWHIDHLGLAIRPCWPEYAKGRR